jgi:diaminopimelate epimerase
VVDKGLTTKQAIKVQTRAGVLEPRLAADGQVTVDMGLPVFDLPRIPFNPAGLVAEASGSWEKWLLSPGLPALPATVSAAIVSMGNPHAVLTVDNTDHAPVQTLGPLVQQQAAFPNGVNVGFMQVLARNHIRLRVYERGAGETLACGSGACAAAVAGIRLGLLDSRVQVDMRGGSLVLEWQKGDAHVFMTGPAVTVFEGSIEIPADAS